MSQFFTLIWLKWTLFRNVMRSRKAVVSRVASALGVIVALALALLIAAGLGVAAYGLLAFDSRRDGLFFLFMVFALIYVMWAVVPLSMGRGSQFDPGRMLLYPISLGKLFAIDFLSELTSLGSIFAIPAMLALAIGAGLGRRNVAMALVVGVCTVMFGIALAKWLSTAMGALMSKRRTRGETVLALLSAVVGLAGAFFGQLAPIIARQGLDFRGLRWTPPGAAAIALTLGLRRGGEGDYALAVVTLIAYTLILIAVTYWIARRVALGGGGGSARRERVKPVATGSGGRRVGWQLPFLSTELSAIIEKELRYAMRNAQLRMMALMPLILIGMRLMRTGGFGWNAGGSGNGGSGVGGRAPSSSSINSLIGGFAQYGDGLIVAGGVLYVFMILSSLACNLFAFEEGGMRSFILSPIERRLILVGKNISVTVIAFIFSMALIFINQLVFRDLTLPALAFALLCFVLWSALFALIGNWFSMRFPKRLQFGKRMNVSGVAGFMLIPIMILLALPPFLAALAGYLAQSFAIKYATLILFAGIALTLYIWLINEQGRSLARRETEILEAVSGRDEGN
jgi:hypothetical protein